LFTQSFFGVFNFRLDIVLAKYDGLITAFELPTIHSCRVHAGIIAPYNSREAPLNMPHPTQLTLHQASRVLEISFDDDASFRLSWEFLRVYSPSAEVRGHGAGQEVLQVGKRAVAITEVEPVGTYAVKLVFSDGHNTGLYAWDYFYDLGKNHDRYWQQYLERLSQAGASRDFQDISSAPTVTVAAGKKGCQA
jgi:DUF971 family protein